MRVYADHENSQGQKKRKTKVLTVSLVGNRLSVNDVAIFMTTKDIILTMYFCW